MTPTYKHLKGEWLPLIAEQDNTFNFTEGKCGFNIRSPPISDFDKICQNSTFLDISRHFSTFLDISRRVADVQEMSKSLMGTRFFLFYFTQLLHLQLNFDLRFHLEGYAGQNQFKIKQRWEVLVLVSRIRSGREKKSKTYPIFANFQTFIQQCVQIIAFLYKLHIHIHLIPKWVKFT